MPYRPEAELKRPDLKGEFLCGHCGKTFCHAASLNRHRLNFHGDDQQCKLCDTKIAAHETVRRHMSTHHQITRVFTCGCCNWTFPDKKELHAHNNSMMRTGHPGEARAIAVSNRVPGSLAQSELRDGTVSPKSPRRVHSPAIKKRKMDSPPHPTTTNLYQNLLGGGSLGQQQGGVLTPAEWLQQFLLNNPAVLPMLATIQQQQVVPVKQEEPSTSSAFDFSSVNSLLSNNNKTTEIIRVMSPLKVATEHDDLASSGPESGIHSGADASPAPSDDSSKEGSPPIGEHHQKKRKSIDSIASFLFKQKQQCAAMQG